MTKSVVISARVPVDIANMIKETCKQQNLSTSKYLQKIVESPSTSLILANGGAVNNIESFELPKEIKQILSAVGGIGVGTMVYKILMSSLPNEKFTIDQRENISLLCAIASGIGGIIAIEKLLGK